VLTAIYFHNRPQCAEAVVFESSSPDGKWVAAVMERHCGTESPFYMHVNLRAAADPLDQAYFSGRSEKGQVFVVEEETRDQALTLEWNSARQITIQCPWCRPARVQHKSEDWGPIAVRYQTP
jgi:hypothetical protein